LKTMNEGTLFVVQAWYVVSVVGTARCAVRAAYSGATSAVARPYCDIRSARCTRAGTSQRDVFTTLTIYSALAGPARDSLKAGLQTKSADRKRRTQSRIERR